MTAQAFRSAVDPDVAAAYRRAGWWGDRTLVDVVREHAAERPDAPALIGDLGTMSWAGYLAAAEHLAGRLVHDHGLEPGRRVAILIPDSATVHAAYLACELAGLTVVGVGPRAGDREIAHLAGKTNAAALVTVAEHRGRTAEQLVADIGAAGFAIDRMVVVPHYEGSSPADSPAPIDETRRIGPDDVFLINSTSGTTGLPKCVVHTQNRWMYFHQQAVASGDLSRDDVFMSVVPAPFGFGIWTAHFTPALCGAPVVVRAQFDASTTLELIERHRVSVIACVSTQFVMMLNTGELGSRDLSSLRCMYTGGESVPYAQARAFEEQTGCTVLQFFGSNETGLLSGTKLTDPPERRLRTAGRVADDMQVRLYDGDVDVTATGRGQPAGRGPATCLGYLDDDMANAALVNVDGWMLMGDICELDDEGWLTVVGRTADVVIRGGKNISAAQVEDEVAAHPAVALAAVVAASDPVLGERVCAYVRLRDGHQLELDELLAFLGDRRTSKELWPEMLIVLGELPRASGGKVAKGDLRADLDRRLGAGAQR